MPVKKMTDMDENKTNTKKSDFTIDKPSLESDFTIDKPSLESDHLIFTVLADIVNEDNLTIKNTSLSHKNNELTPDRIQLSEPLVNLTSLEYGEELLQEPAKQVDQTTEEGENDLKAGLYKVKKKYFLNLFKKQLLTAFLSSHHGCLKID